MQCISHLTGEVSTVVPAHHSDSPGSLRHPVGVAVDASSNRLYVGDSFHHCIRSVDIKSGAVRTVAGWPDEEGLLNGRGQLARFFHPYVGAAACGVMSCGCVGLAPSLSFTHLSLF